jgi:hypothetical protein
MVIIRTTYTLNDCTEEYIAFEQCIRALTMDLVIYEITLFYLTTVCKSGLDCIVVHVIYSYKLSH